MKNSPCCPCPDVEHYHDRATRDRLKSDIRYYRKHGLFERVLEIQRSLRSCPNDWRHIPWSHLALV